MITNKNNMKFLNNKIRRVSDKLIVGYDYVDINSLYPHEEILEDRLEGLLEYIKSLTPYIIVPSILVCSKSNVIIDGHHRYYALKKLNKTNVPVTKINYNTSEIITGKDSVNSLSKQEIISSAIENKIFTAKSTEHHFLVEDKKLPLILLSKLMLVE